MSETLIDRVVSIKQAVASQLPHGAALSEAQQAEILIAQVQAILAGSPATAADVAWAEQAIETLEPEEKA